MVVVGAAFLVITPGRAQAPAPPVQHVWTMEFLKVKPGMFQQTLSLLDVGWERTRAEAKKQGVIVSYGRVGEEPSVPATEWDVILLTEYETDAAYRNREEAFAPILKNLFPSGPPQIGMLTKKDLYQIVATRVLRDYPESGTARLVPVKP